VALPRVLPDTNVCYPISLLDLILRCDEASLITVLWTEDLLNELERTWVRERARSASSASHICQQIRTAFAGQDIPRADYELLIPQMPGNDPDDHVHAAAAAVARAPVTLLTNNIRDFPQAPLAERGVTVSRPDDFLVGLAALHLTDLKQVIQQMAASRRQPRMTESEVLDALVRSGLSKFAALVRS
jgi:hypothetical protein